MTRTIDLSNVTLNGHNIMQVNRFGNDYAFIHFNNGNITTRLPKSFRINGVSIMLCVAGQAEIKINFENVTLRSGSLVVLGSEALVEVDNNIPNDMEGYGIFLSPQFINNLNIDTAALDYKRIALKKTPVIELDATERHLINLHLQLLNIHAESSKEENVYTRNAARSLMAATFYQLMNFTSSLIGENAESRPRKRGLTYVEEFLRLVHENFRSERSVTFYAQKLFISPKYLSLTIKEATGATASEWIDRLVLLEAKNLLRYSGLNIQQIAYRLNFSNQSSFGKYFKHLTGLSPTDFRRQ